MFPLFQINQWLNLDRQEKENLARLDFNILELPALLDQLESVSLLMGRLQLTIVKNEEDDFFGYVDWRVRFRFIQSSCGMILFLKFSTYLFVSIYYFIYFIKERKKKIRKKCLCLNFSFHYSHSYLSFLSFVLLNNNKNNVYP